MAKRSHEERREAMGKRVLEALDGCFTLDLGLTIKQEWLPYGDDTWVHFIYVIGEPSSFALFFEPRIERFFSLIDSEGRAINLRKLLETGEIQFLPDT